MEYAAYIHSPGWRTKRAMFLESGLFKGECWICGQRALSFDVHHRTYKRLGQERLTDLVALCRGCHDFVHTLHRRHGGDLWRITSRARSHLGHRGWRGCQWCHEPVLRTTSS